MPAAWLGRDPTFVLRGRRSRGAGAGAVAPLSPSSSRQGWRGAGRGSPKPRRSLASLPGETCGGAAGGAGPISILIAGLGGSHLERGLITRLALGARAGRAKRYPLIRRSLPPPGHCLRPQLCPSNFKSSSLAQSSRHSLPYFVPLVPSFCSSRVSVLCASLSWVPLLCQPALIPPFFIPSSDFCPCIPSPCPHPCLSLYISPPLPPTPLTDEMTEHGHMCPAARHSRGDHLGGPCSCWGGCRSPPSLGGRSAGRGSWVHALAISPHWPWFGAHMWSRHNYLSLLAPPFFKHRTLPSLALSIWKSWWHLTPWVQPGEGGGKGS
jgi:hypothetical protein